MSLQHREAVAPGAVGITTGITVSRDAEEAQRFLAEFSVILGSSLDYETTLDSLAHLLVPRFASYCTVDLLGEDGAINQVTVAHAEPSKEGLLREMRQLNSYDAVAAYGVAHVLRTGEAELVCELSDALLEAFAPGTESLSIIRELDPASYIIVPLVARGRTLGALCLVAEKSRPRYNAADLRLAQDLAGRAALAVDNARLYREAREANRIKDEFLATLSHELRTPLAAILGWTHLLRNAPTDEATTQRALDTIERNARTQAQLIEDLLDISRITAGKLRLEMRPTDLARVIQAALNTVRPAAAARGVELHAELDATVDPVAGDPARLQQVVWNLLANAVKFTPRQGHVEVRLRRAGEHARITITDTGQGISAEFLPYVFERFRQSDSTSTRRHGGLGLGLSIVRHLVEMHGGSVVVESRGVGQGATFSVQLPLPEVALARPGQRREVSALADGMEPVDPPTRLAGLRLLVVDDEADARDLVALILVQHGATVRKASGADEALRLVQEEVPDVLLCDIAMPGQDGYELMGRLRALDAGSGGATPAVALTAYARAEDRLAALSAGYQLHVSKPVEPADLLAAVEQAAGRGAPVGELLTAHDAD